MDMDGIHVTARNQTNGDVVDTTIRFASDVDPETKARLDHGKILMEVIKQGQYRPLKVEHQVMIIYAASNDMLDDLDVSVIKDFEEQFFKYMDDRYPEIKREIHETGNFSEETEALMRKGIEEFKEKGFING